jgi:hypothetical protein
VAPSDPPVAPASEASDVRSAGRNRYSAARSGMTKRDARAPALSTVIVSGCAASATTDVS